LKKDIVSKDILKSIIKDIAKYILKFEIDTLELIESEFERVESRRADVVAKVDGAFILHLEIQNGNDYTMPKRMLRYWLDIKSVERTLPIKQYLIYIGKAKCRIDDTIVEEQLDYRYHLIDIKSIDCEYLLNEDTPDALVLAILCDFKDKNPKDIVKYIIDRLQFHTQQTPDEFRRYMMMLEELSTNRDLKDTVKEVEMLSNIRYEDLPSYEIGIEKGVERGIQQGIEKGIQRGIQSSMVMVAKQMLKLNQDIQLIAQITQLSPQKIEKLKKEMDG